ncbi:MAG: hypothetical protein HY552_01015 [Elusimicrobia bacterium]|nr:hypothetical protein [Elusimicrobiota bacterium]
MKRSTLWIAAAALLGAASVALAVKPETASEKSVKKEEAAKGAMGEKEKALASPYPNDLGPEALPDEVLKSYPANVQAGYKMLVARCSQCHASSRPLNSRFVEPDGGSDDAKQEAALAKLKKEQPDLFKDGSVWQVEVKLWNRYVKRMMNKPGCSISKAEGKQIWEFLEHDGVQRKTGANAAKWAEHRRKLIAEFKAKYSKRYEELAAAKDL